jgi:hypothetical protein
VRETTLEGVYPSVKEVGGKSKVKAPRQAGKETGTRKGRRTALALGFWTSRSRSLKVGKPKVGYGRSGPRMD